MLSRSLIERVVLWGRLVKFSHSVFALPFAAIMVLAVWRRYAVTWQQLVLLLICVVAARTAAMAFNRVVDAGFDARNDRTKIREIPAGHISRSEGLVLVVAASVVFIAAAFGLGSHCGVLAIPVLGILCGYSFVKRFSSLCHFVLGLSLALAPGGVWYALTATWSWTPVPLMVSVLLWVAGFDILYACQDYEFDRKHGLMSVPSLLGIQAARWLSSLLHLGSVASLVVFGLEIGFGVFFWLGVVSFSVLIASQHRTIFKRGLASIDQVFFVRNGLASVVLFVSVLVDHLL
jgi:4-hydroxybenzoate polyprenyltransferase